MASTWVFECSMGLYQDTCGQYEKDGQSRGAGHWAGCASCIHRQPGNAETKAAENYYEAHSKKEATAKA